MSKDTPAPVTEPVTSPGWMFEVDTGFCMGPASYEQAELFIKSGGKPISTTRAGVPISYTIRPSPVAWTPVKDDGGK